jgi:hypothetical protein
VAVICSANDAGKHGAILYIEFIIVLSYEISRRRRRRRRRHRHYQPHQSRLLTVRNTNQCLLVGVVGVVDLVAHKVLGDSMVVAQAGDSMVVAQAEV